MRMGRSVIFTSVLGSQETQTRAVIDTAASTLPPCTVFEIPADGLGQALFEGSRRFPAKLAMRLRRVDCIARVMSGTIGHESNEKPSRSRARRQSIQHVTNLGDYL